MQGLILNDEGKAYTLLLDTAFLTSDMSVLQSCITIISRLNTKGKNVMRISSLKQAYKHMIEIILKKTLRQKNYK